jgi:hypothetical protein
MEALRQPWPTGEHSLENRSAIILECLPEGAEDGVCRDIPRIDMFENVEEGPEECGLGKAVKIWNDRQALCEPENWAAGQRDDAERPKLVSSIRSVRSEAFRAELVDCLRLQPNEPAKGRLQLLLGGSAKRPGIKLRPRGKVKPSPRPPHHGRRHRGAAIIIFLEREAGCRTKIRFEIALGCPCIVRRKVLPEKFSGPGQRSQQVQDGRFLFEGIAECDQMTVRLKRR